MERGDYVDELILQWGRERPSVDVSTMGVIGRISRLSRILERQIEEIFAAHGLHSGRFDVLAALVRAGPPNQLTPTELYNALLISSGAITNRVDRLEQEGLVKRVAPSEDGRSSPVRLTENGRTRLDAALLDHLENEHRLLASLGQERRDQLTETLRAWLMGLGDSGQRVQAETIAKPSPI